MLNRKYHVACYDSAGALAFFWHGDGLIYALLFIARRKWRDASLKHRFVTKAEFRRLRGWG